MMQHECCLYLQTHGAIPEHPSRSGGCVGSEEGVRCDYVGESCRK